MRNFHLGLAMKINEKRNSNQADTTVLVIDKKTRFEASLKTKSMHYKSFV